MKALIAHFLHSVGTQTMREAGHASAGGRFMPVCLVPQSAS